MGNFAKEVFEINSGLGSAEEYQQLQLYKNLKKNVENNTLPFFNSENSYLPRELSTGKIINDENLVILEQIAANNGYKSNIWIYGSELNKIDKTLSFRKPHDQESAALCLTRIYNPTHTDNMFYINQGGAKDKNGKYEKCQYLYNIDSLSDKSRQIVLDKFKKVATFDQKYREKNAQNLFENSELLKSNAKIREQLQTQQELIKKNSIIKKKHGSMRIDWAVNALSLHCLSSCTGLPPHPTQISKEREKNCYDELKRIFDSYGTTTEAEKINMGGQLLKSFAAGVELQRYYTAKNFDMGQARKEQEQNERSARLSVFPQKNQTQQQHSSMER